MGCCVCDDHDYCCRCYEGDERAISIVDDVLDGSYDGEAEIPIFQLPPTDTLPIAKAIVAVLKHEGVI